jgi:threonine/homoserine/homoserine lactone efflux protein
MLMAHELAWFALAALVLVLTPGPNMIYCVSRTLCQGRMAGLISLGGVLLGFVVHLLAAALGLTALLMAVPLAFDAIRLAGAAYLLWLAWQAVKPDGVAPFQARELPRDRAATLFRMGFITNLLNPKVAMFRSFRSSSIRRAAPCCCKPCSSARCSWRSAAASTPFWWWAPAESRPSCRAAAAGCRRSAGS